MFISETASAPSASTALAISVILVTLGESFTTRGFDVAFLTFEVISAALVHDVPNAAPPCFTLGHDILSSII